MKWAEHAAHHAEHREVIARSHLDGALHIGCGLQHNRGATMHQRADLHARADARRNDVAVLCTR